MIYVILICIVSVGVALFAVQNPIGVEVTFLTWNFQTSLVMVILSSLISGLFIAFCWGLKLKAQHYLSERKIQEQVANLEEEKTRLQEKIEMLMHTQKQRVEANMAEQSAMNNAKSFEFSQAPELPKFDPNK